MMNTWHNVHDELPAIGAECIVLNDEGRISFSHMVDKAVAVDYGGWNIPNVVWWMHFEPSEELEKYYGQDGGPKQTEGGRTIKKTEDALNTEARRWASEQQTEYTLSEVFTDWLRNAFIAGGNYGMSHGPMSRHEMRKLSRVFCHNHCDKALRLHCDIYNARGHAYACPQLAQFQTDVRYVFNDGHFTTDEED